MKFWNGSKNVRCEATIKREMGSYVTTVMNRKHIRREEQQRSGVSKSARVCTCNQSWFKKVKRWWDSTLVAVVSSWFVAVCRVKRQNSNLNWPPIHSLSQSGFVRMCLSMSQFSPGSKQNIVLGSHKVASKTSHVHKMRILVTKKSVICLSV